MRVRCSGAKLIPAPTGPTWTPTPWANDGLDAPNASAATAMAAMNARFIATSSVGGASTAPTMNSLGEGLVPSAIGLWRFGNVAARRHNHGAARGGCRMD